MDKEQSLLNEMTDLMTEEEIAIIEKETEKIRKILTEEQFAKWQQAASADRQVKGKRPHSPERDRGDRQHQETAL